MTDARRRMGLDPNTVIAAAFKAAGLPVPEKRQPGSRMIDPGWHHRSGTEGGRTQTRS